jgi:TrmH family RNA methyltransferase
LEMIQSRQNRLIKQLRSLHSRSGREKLGLFLLEGVRLIEAAADAELRLPYVVFNSYLESNQRGLELLARLQRQGSQVYQVADRLLCELADTDRPQGILAAAEIPAEPAEWPEASTILVLDGVQDPGNLGTLIRTADALGVDLIIALKGTVDPYNEKVVRAAMGSLFHLPLIQNQEASDVLPRLREAGAQIVVSCLSPDAVPYLQAAYRDKVALVVGNEGAGVSDLWLEEADQRVIIPQRGAAESLNVGVATGILLAHISARF